MLTLAALAVIASGCSQTDRPEPVVVRQPVHIDVAPEARKSCPALSPKPIRSMSEAEVFNGWAGDRTARNICEARRAAAISAIDAANSKDTP